jgi:hypothetical protein
MEQEQNIYRLQSQERIDAESQANAYKEDIEESYSEYYRDHYRGKYGRGNDHMSEYEYDE